MKRMLNRKKRPIVQRKGLNPRKRFFRTIKSCKKPIIQIESPRNTSQYLIENNSTPFFDENEDDDDCDFTPNPLLLLKEAEDMQEENSLTFRKVSSLSTQPESFPLDDQHINFEQSYLF